MSERRRPTMADVAQRASVSITTVSHMLSGRRAVSAHARARIESAIDELGFRPNQTARALFHQRTNTVAFVARNIAHESASLVARGASRVLREAGYTVAIFETDDNASGSGVIDSVIDRVCDGALLYFPGGDAPPVHALRKSGVPFVLLNNSSNDEEPADHVGADEFGGIRKATQHVIASTDGRIGFIGGSSQDERGVLRRSAFLSAIEEAGRPVDHTLVVEAERSVVGGRTAMRELLGRARDVRGLVCANDLIAIGAIEEAHAWDIPVPAQLVVTGYGNIELAGMMTPSLTTVETFELELGAEGARVLLARITGEADNATADIVLGSELVVRSSAPTPSGGFLS